MAVVTNLTFSEVNAETTADSKIGTNIFSINAGVVSMNVSALTGDTYADLDDPALCELFYKLHKYCQRAQETVNNAVAIDGDGNIVEAETLKTFSPVTFGIPSALGQVDVDLSQSILLSLDDSAPVGVN
jgi:hypothetical protein